MTYLERRTVVRDRDSESGKATRGPGPLTAGHPGEGQGSSDGTMARSQATQSGQTVDERVAVDRTVTARPTPTTMAARVVALIFGLIQLIVALRIVFLGLAANQGNGLVAGILDLSRPLVGPFEGIFQTNAMQAGEAVLDVSAIAALIGWTIVEMIVIAIIRLRRPGTDV